MSLPSIILHRASGFLGVTILILMGFALPCHAAPMPETKLGEGADVQMGGFGAGNGKFEFLCDLTIGPGDHVYALDGAQYDGQSKSMKGNQLVQEFDSAGKFIRQFAVVESQRGPTTGTPTPNMPELTANPQRIAVDGAGRVFITQPWAECVQQYDASGKLEREIPLPQAMAITRYLVDGKDRIAVLPSQNEVPPGAGWTWMGGDKIVLIEPASGAIEKTIPLSQKLTNVEDITPDAAGNFYVLADKHQLYKFDPLGKVLKIIGGGSETRVTDGSELNATVAVDSKGNVYSMTFGGNPGMVTRFNADFTTITQRGGWFHWGDSWSYPSNYTPFAIDSTDHLWTGCTRIADPNGPNYARQHYTPAIQRLQSNYFDLGVPGIIQSNALTMGLSPRIQADLPYSISYDLKPIGAQLILPAANRMVDHVGVAWAVYDEHKNAIDKGEFDLPLTQGKESRSPLSFIPPRFGWYMLEVKLSSSGQELMGIGAHFGVTPPFANIPILKAGESHSGWTDAARQAFVGLTLMRLHPSVATEQSLASLDEQISQAEKFGDDFFCQFSDVKDCTPENVTKVVTRFKGRVKVWEVMNEPNFSLTPEKYVQILKQISPLIKSIDPEAKVMGPDVCGIQIPWYEAFYKLGGGPLVDILSIHDYEGHETIDPTHWLWKFGVLRKLMADNGDASKPLWQTERCVSGVRGGDFTPMSQAVRLLLHQDLLETLGIPSNHDMVYYLNQGGYSDVPAYVWSDVGPHPAALALRTRAAMIGKARYADQLDFGSTGNKVYMGLHFSGDDAEIFSLRNLGTATQTLAMHISDSDKADLTDSFGNSTSLAIVNGIVKIPFDQLPSYVRVAKGGKLMPILLDLGPNLARDAAFSYSAASSQIGHLNDGIWQTINAGNPAGDTNGKAIFVGELPTMPQTLDITLGRRQAVGALLIAGLHADNNFCALLDFDVQALGEDGKWNTVREVRTPIAPSDWVKTPDSQATTWYDDSNRFLVSFNPVTTSKIRLVILRVTQGFAPDDLATKAVVKTWGGKGNPAKFMLREVEIYGVGHEPASADATATN